MDKCRHLHFFSTFTTAVGSNYQGHLPEIRGEQRQTVGSALASISAALQPLHLYNSRSGSDSSCLLLSTFLGAACSMHPEGTC